jgi:hypothetical protein
MILLLSSNNLPTVYRGNDWSEYMLSKKERESLNFSISSLTLFYPVWGSYYYRLSEDNAKNRPDIINENHVAPLRSACNKSNWSDKDKCLEYMSAMLKERSHQDEFLNNISNLYDNYPDLICKTGRGYVFYVGHVFAKGVRLDHPNMTAHKDRRHETNSRFLPVYDKYLKTYIESSAKNGCESNAVTAFEEIKASEEHYGNWKPKESSIKYFKSICSQYEVACNYIWGLYFSVHYKRNEEVTNKLHHAICSKSKKLFCTYKRDMTVKEYNAFRRKMEAKGVRMSPFQK